MVQKKTENRMVQKKKKKWVEKIKKCKEWY